MAGKLGTDFDFGDQNLLGTMHQLASNMGHNVATSYMAQSLADPETHSMAAQLTERVNGQQLQGPRR